MVAQPNLLPCHVCGNPATELIQDLREGAPVGQWRTWEPDGPLHMLCDEHRRLPRLTYAQGTPEAEIVRYVMADVDSVCIARATGALPFEHGPMMYEHRSCESA